MSRRVCAIVGAGEGLGQALARRFAAEGFDIGLVSRTEAGSRAAMEAARTANGEVSVQFEAGDALQPESIEAALKAVIDTLGDPGVLIYNVRGGFAACEPLDISYRALSETFSLEVAGALAAAKAVVPAMRAGGSGTVMFSSATAAYRGSAQHGLYAIGKFGLRALSQSLAKAYAADGVHVVHMRLDCDLDVPVMKQVYGDAYATAKLADPDAVAESYWLVHRQPKGAWSNEVELRPHTETWTI